jgi:hypothetical protein
MKTQRKVLMCIGAGLTVFGVAVAQGLLPQVTAAKDNNPLIDPSKGKLAQTVRNDMPAFPIMAFQYGETPAIWSVYSGFLRNNCMIKNGYKQWAGTPVLTDPLEPLTLSKLREFRAISGYGYVDTAIRNVQLRKQDAIRRAADEAIGSAETPRLNQAIAECDSSAEKNAQMLTPMSDAALVSELSRELSVLDSDPKLAEATKEWSKCVARAGGEVYDFLEGPARHVADLVSNSSDPEEIRAEEMRIAAIDFTCQETILLPVYQPAQAALVDRLVAKFPRWSTQVEYPDFDFSRLR